MKIEAVEVTPVNIQLEAPIRWAWGVRTAATRNIVQLHTDMGLVGLGETMGGSAITALTRKLGADLIGLDPFQMESILSRFQLTSYFHGYGGLAAIGGLEAALWDLQGKASGRPVCDLLGGRYRDQVEFSAYVFYRYPEGTQGGESTPEEIVQYCLRWREDAGFRVWKLKAGVFPPKHDLQVLQAMRRTLGDEAQLRIDPNAVWSPQTTLALRPQLEELSLEYLEDPTWGIDNMARVRREIRIPLATNMCVVEFDQIPAAVKLGAVDVVLGDFHKWGGLLAVKKLAAVCETFGLGLSLHSGVELGISTAANLHLAAATPHLRYAVDSHALHQAGDIITGNPFRFQNGCLRVPTGPGLGVELDPEKFKHAALLHQRMGDAGSVGDPYAQEFIPVKQKW